LDLHRSARALLGRGTSLAALRKRAEAVVDLEEAVQLAPDKAHPRVNLAGVLQTIGRDAEGEVHCRQALKLKPDSREALMNLANILRNTGRRSEALALVWNRIDENVEDGSVGAPRPALDCSAWETCGVSGLTVVCVKWGSRYDSSYVNRLYEGVRRHYSEAVPFVCFTENGEGLTCGVEVRPLPDGYRLWWGKAYLFSSAAGLDGRRVLYLDLDQVLVGSLEQLAQYSGAFAVLSTDDIACELAKGGFNSSVMSWEASSFWRYLHEGLNERVLQFVHRFDHWLEMNVTGAHVFQDIVPRAVVDYTTVFRGGVVWSAEEGDGDARVVQGLTEPPEGAVVVTFPRHPKPHDVLHLHQWVRQHWLGESVEEVSELP